MNTPFFYGLVLAFGNIVLTLVGFFLGYQTDKLVQGRWFGVLPFVLVIGILWLGIRAVREEAKDKSLSYGKGVGTGFLITLYSSLIGTVYGFIHFKFINPNFVDYQIDAAHEKWAQAGLSDAQIEAAEKGMRFIMSPVVLSITGLLASPLIGLVIALVLAAFLKRKPEVIVDLRNLDLAKDAVAAVLTRPPEELAETALTADNEPGLIEQAVGGLLKIYQSDPQGFVAGAGGAREAELRRIGEVLNARGGMDLMRLAHAHFASQCPIQGADRNLEFMWDGIGSWRG